MAHVGDCADAATPAVHVLLLPHAEPLDTDRLQRLQALAAAGTFSAVLGPDVPAEPGHGVRGTGLRREPPPSTEWAAISLGPCVVGAVLARRAPDGESVWHYGITSDRGRTIAAARSVVRLLGAPEPRFRYDG
jgi:hypothetical protein